MSTLLQGLNGPVSIIRDRWGIPHAKAGSAADAFFAQGFVHAQDRLWQMEYDRRRAAGRWAELVGQAGVAQDMLMRRFGLYESSRRDYERLGAASRAMFDAYTAGVNAFVGQASSLPREFALLGLAPEPWQPWDGMAVYKVRHVMMGVWEGKLWRAKLMNRLGPELLKALYPTEREGDLLILPPGATFQGAVETAVSELLAVAGGIAWMKDEQGGSNNWVVDGARTASGKPLMAGDPHRAIDVPNVYYQNHIACDEFDVAGLSFPGLPGFPHFGHNDRVAWCITHTGADTQDLFVERFEGDKYLFREKWLQGEVKRERIGVRGGAPVEFDVIRTHHGPVIGGGPARGYALSMAYTATLPENPGWECLLPMLKARSCVELDATMRGWVDPVNNLLYADVDGNTGYRMRGAVPLRPTVNGWLPVPGWSGEYEWRGMIPFEELPHVLNAGYVVTANNQVVGGDYPYYIALQFTAQYRARRITDRLMGASSPLTVAEMASIHADVLSLCALEMKGVLDLVHPVSPEGAAALELLRSWDGQVKADLAAPAIYNAMREELVGALLRPLLGPLFPEAFSASGRGGPQMVANLRRTVWERIRSNDTTLLPSGMSWGQLLTDALEAAVAALGSQFGPDMGAWQWGRLHQVRSQHPLAGLFPGEGLSPAPVPMDGDGDTVQAASYHPGTGFTVSGTSVARYVFDLADWDSSGWVVPDLQAEAWQGHRLVPMLYSWERILEQEAPTAGE